CSSDRIATAGVVIESHIRTINDVIDQSKGAPWQNALVRKKGNSPQAAVRNRQGIHHSITNPRKDVPRPGKAGHERNVSKVDADFGIGRDIRVGHIKQPARRASPEDRLLLNRVITGQVTKVLRSAFTKSFRILSEFDA